MSDAYEKYKTVRELYPDALLAIQTGDIFGFFDGDAEKVAEVIRQDTTYYTITRKKRQPYIEVADREIKTVFEKLLESGFTIAVVEPKTNLQEDSNG